MQILALVQSIFMFVANKLWMKDIHNQKRLLIANPPVLDVTITDISVEYKNAKSYDVHGCLNSDQTASPESKYYAHVQYSIRNHGDVDFVAPFGFVDYAACGTPAILGFLDLKIEGGIDGSGNPYPAIELNRFATCVIDDSVDAGSCVAGGPTTDFSSHNHRLLLLSANEYISSNEVDESRRKFKMGTGVSTQSLIGSPAPPTTSTSPSPAPTATPTAPTASPTAEPTAPTLSPTAKPTFAPTAPPTLTPTAPTAQPTAKPTTAPTYSPTAKPTNAPTARPTATPTATPTAPPTAAPTTAPTAPPTATPTTAEKNYTIAFLILVL